MPGNEIHDGSILMFTDDDIEELKVCNICFNCVEDDYLKAQISKKTKRKKCSYCGGTVKCYSIEELSKCIETAFDQHFYQTPDQPTGLDLTMHMDIESDYEWERDGEPVVDAIVNAAGIPEKAASDIQKILEDKFGDYSHHGMGEKNGVFV